MAATMFSQKFRRTAPVAPQVRFADAPAVNTSGMSDAEIKALKDAGIAIIGAVGNAVGGGGGGAAPPPPPKKDHTVLIVAAVVLGAVLLMRKA